jgi:hypothetical protein
MSSIVPRNGGSENPFDEIKMIDEHGRETWSARDLQELCGYAEWRKFENAIERAKIATTNAGYDVIDHIVGADSMVNIGSGAQRPAADWKLSRFACYLVVMNGDPRKPEIARAQEYFAVKTREAEVAVITQKDAVITSMDARMGRMESMMERMLGIMERNEAKVATHDLLAATELEISMTELSAILGLPNVKSLTAALRGTGVLIKQRYPVAYGGKTYTRFRNTPRTKWRGFIVVRTQTSGTNSVTVPYVRPSGVAPIHAHLLDQGYDVAPLPSVEEQREIIAIVRERHPHNEITSD